MNKIVRILLIVFAVFLLGSYVIGVLDPMLGVSEPPFPTRAEAAVNGIPLLIYSIFILVQPRWLMWMPVYYLVLIGRIMGLIVVLVTVGGILWDQGTTFESFLFLSLFPGLLLILPTGLAVWEIAISRSLAKKSLKRDAAKDYRAP
jgi:hypothetical protein